VYAPVRRPAQSPHPAGAVRGHLDGRLREPVADGEETETTRPDQPPGFGYRERSVGNQRLFPAPIPMTAMPTRGNGVAVRASTDPFL
jgi:hypothetical protein